MSLYTYHGHNSNHCQLGKTMHTEWITMKLYEWKCPCVKGESITLLCAHSLFLSRTEGIMISLSAPPIILWILIQPYHDQNYRKMAKSDVVMRCIKSLGNTPDFTNEPNWLAKYSRLLYTCCYLLLVCYPCPTVRGIGKLSKAATCHLAVNIYK